MKAILISINPKWVAKILNGEKTIEIRKKFPKDYVGWVYIYCTKNGGNFGSYKGNMAYGFSEDNIYWQTRCANGKVIARFWCDKVEEIKQNDNGYYYCDSLVVPYGLQKFSCLTQEELDDYLKGNNGYAIHITKLEIFDKPKEISDFYKVGYGECAKPQGSLREQVIENYNNALKYQLTRAPQSWCYIKI